MTDFDIADSLISSYECYPVEAAVREIVRSEEYQNMTREQKILVAMLVGMRTRDTIR